jgi:hypothetical protein
VDYQKQTVKALGVIESILGHGIEDIPDDDTDANSHWDEDGRIPTIISREHQ